MRPHIRAMSILLAMMGLVWPVTGWSQTMADYTAVPPFVSSVAPPNVLIILDNSGSMGRRANCTLASGLSAGGYDACPTFDETNRYGGLFDPMRCYVYVASNQRFEPTNAKTVITTQCASSDWDGNFLNWVTLRRLDMAKIALIGGVCAVPRTASGNCPPTGSPAMVTIKGHDGLAMPSGASISTPGVLVGSGTNRTQGRVPSGVTSGISNGNPIRFHLFGTTGSGPWPLMGWFCTDNDATPPAANSTTCSSGGSSWNNRQGFRIRVAVPVEPEGVIQNTGNRVRFGLMEYIGNDGGRVMVPIGSFLYRQLDVVNVSSHASNTVAMIQGIEDTYNQGNTPMAMTFYEAARYIGQVNSSLASSSYRYPIAFSPGVGLGSSGAGGMGPGEVKDLAGTDTCPSGYITDACGRDPFFLGSAHSPAWASPATQAPCCKTFVVVFTDGDSQQDQTIPSFLSDFAHNIHGVHCTGNDTSSPTAPINTTCNMHPDTAASHLIREHRTDYTNSGSHYLDDVAYWAHITDLRAPTVTAQVPGSATVNTVWTGGRDLPGFQNITTYTFFAFEQTLNKELLLQTARVGGFEDKNNNGIPDNGLTPGAPCNDVDLSTPCEYDSVNNLTGAPGRDGVPDTYFGSSDVVFMQERLTAVINHILSKSASGTSISVLASSASGEGSIYQAYFFTNDVGQGGANVKWTGYTHGLFVDGFGNFREDTVKDGVLDYKTDLIIKTRFDNDPFSPTYKKVLVDKYVDLDGDGVADSETPAVVGDDLKNIKPIWEAGAELANTPSSARKILTWVDPNGNGLVDATEQIDFSAANCAVLRDYLRYASDPCTGSSDAMNLINFIRGDEVTGLRTRMMEVPIGSGSYKVWKLGDPIHSTPTIVAAPTARFDLLYGDASYNAFFQQYRNRRQVVYVGANDGMLHAFNGGFYHKGDNPDTPGTVEHGWFTKTPTDNASGPNLGAELWGFVPMELLPQLQWLARNDYTHVYYVDLKPTVADVRIFTPDADHPGGWGTVLIGGFRMGGSCGNCVAGSGAPPMTASIGGVPRTFYSAYFVLDITNPEVSPKLLWSFSDVNLGLTTSMPAVVRVNPDGDVMTGSVNEKWYVVFGSGPNSYQAELPVTATLQTAAFYAVDLAAGPGLAQANVTRMPTGSWRSFMGPLVAADKDLDYRTDVVYGGRTMHSGSLPWRGKMYRLTVRCPAAPCLPASWGIASGANRVPTEMIDTFSDPSLGTVAMGPPTAGPTWTVDDSNQMWVFFGTGRYIGNADKVDNSTQYLFGMKDKVVNGTCTQSTQVNCWTNDLVDATNAVVCLVCSGSTNQVTDPTNPGVTTFHGTGTTSMIGLVDSKDGWRVTLPGPVSITSGGITTAYAAERSVVSPTLLGGTVFFPTYAPTSDFCGSDGTSYLYALFYKTGTASTAPVVGTSTSGGNTNVTTKVALGVGMASALSVHVGQQGATLLSQMSNSNTTTTLASPGDFYSRFVSWVHQRD